MYENLSLIYDSYMQDVDYESWAEYLTALIKEKKNDTKAILEYGCGSGNLTLPLSKQFDVTGVDLSEEMLTLAESKLRETETHLFRGDLRNFKYNNQVDAVILACDTLTMFDYEDIEKFFKRVFDQLKPGGVLLFDILSESYLKDYIAPNNFIFDDEDTYFTWSSEASKDYIDSYFTFFIKEGISYKRVDDSQRQYILDVTRIEELLEESGFSDIKVYDFPTKKEASGQADRIQFVSVKP